MKRFILGILIVAALAGCGKKKDEYAYDLKLRPVVYEQVQEKSNIVERDYSGIVKSEALSNLSFRVSGTMIKKFVDIGDSIKKGEILAQLDNTEYQVKYQQSLADLHKGEALLADAKANYERSKTLYLENSISKAQFQSSLANYESSLSSVVALRKGVEYANIQLGYTNLIAPADGTIGSVETEVNQVVSPQNTIFTLNTTGQQSVEFTVSESIVPLLNLGEPVKLRIDSLGGIEVPGKITNIGTVSSGFGNTYPVKAEIESTNPQIRAGMTATVKLNVGLNKNSDKVMVIPLSSILKDFDGKEYVYIIKDIKDEAGVVEKKLVKTGQVSNLGIEIIDGLKPGEFIVSRGAGRLQEGEKVGVPSKGDN
ncbi:MAG: efflux RND transporter periplasmic adaptor subunit [Cetobacterium sp.]